MELGIPRFGHVSLDTDAFQNVFSRVEGDVQLAADVSFEYP
jgi:hypothetical protein